MNTAAVILCAGKGTRMNDDSLNKVCFPCAGIPVIRRIVLEMKAGGVERFVIVVGHHPKDVMDALDGIDGVVYAYQKEQKGTGNAALCGMNALKTVGYTGSVIISMGDKFVSKSVISKLIKTREQANVKVSWSVQRLNANPNGGRVVIFDNEPCGIVEQADVALMSLAGIPENEWNRKLSEIGLNSKKAEKVIKASREGKAKKEILLNGRLFTAKDILNGKFANAGLYCFEIDSAMTAIKSCQSNNVQGELYITDTLEYFAKRKQAMLVEIENELDLLTYSTKPELAKMSRHFMKKASELSSSEIDKERFERLRKCFIDNYGDKKAVITSAPGRVNLMGRHIDHRGGTINVMAINYDTMMIVSPREDDKVVAVNVDKNYAKCEFSIGEELSLADYSNWLKFLESDNVKERLNQNRGSWINYIKSAVLRFQTEIDYPVCGMNIAVCGNVPPAAGLSSSSSLVVATAEAVNSLNSMNLSNGRFIDLCGEGEWYVGSRGGAGDHAAMKTSKKNYITRLGFKPFTLGEQAKFSEDYAVLVVNSMILAKKSEGSRSKFNEKVACYEFALKLIRKGFPEYDLIQFRDIAEIRPYSRICEMLLTLPEKITRKELVEILNTEDLSLLFASHTEPEYYDLRGVALYGISECLRATKFMDLLKTEDYIELGNMIKTSHNGDRLTGFNVSEEYLKELMRNNSDLSKEYGAYACSTKEIDDLCDMLDSIDGVLGTSLSGAGLGGSVIAIVQKNKVDKILDFINKNYYDKNGYPHVAFACVPSSGSKVIY